MAPVPGRLVSEEGLNSTLFLNVPRFISQYATLVFLASTVFIGWYIFIEMVAYVTRKTIEQMVNLLVSPSESMSNVSSGPSRRKHPLLPYVVAHMLLDETCPITSHTPAEMPKETVKGKTRVLPERVASPCGICSDGIRMGEMKRTLPCSHRFHARCIDNVCIVESFWKDSNAGGSINCPSCKFVLVPTPELLEECLSISMCSSGSDRST